MDRRSFAALVAAAVATPCATTFAKAAPTEWDGLVRVKSKRLQYVYLLPGADFRSYTSVKLDPPEVAFAKNWLRDINDSSALRRLTDADAQKILDEAREGFQEILAKAYADAGYHVANTAGANVLRLRTGITHLYIRAPERNTAGRSNVYAVDAGSATVVLEARDSLTGALLGRAIDSQIAGDNTVGRRTSVSNRADFSLLFRSWARASANGLAVLKSMSPIPAN